MRFRAVGVACDAEDMPGFNGDSCGDEITLYGGATYADVEADARRAGWKILGGRTHMGRRYLCPRHADLSTTKK